VGAAVIGAVFATGLFVVRGGDAGPSLLAGVLGQGSLLFVDTQVLNYVPQYEPYAWGSTYLDSGFSAVGLGAWASRGSLAEWLVDIYAPGSSGGYGFSMIAEVTMNFSQWGILPAFLLLGVVITRLTKTSGNSAFAAFMKVFLVVFVPYMLRSDSVGLFSGVVSAILFFVFLSVFTKGETTAARED